MTTSIVTYFPRSPFASDRVSFGYPDGSVTLQREVSQSIESGDIEWLKENSEEFRLATEQNIIIIKTIDNTPTTPKTSALPDAGVKAK